MMTFLFIVLVCATAGFLFVIWALMRMGSIQSRLEERMHIDDGYDK